MDCIKAFIELAFDILFELVVADGKCLKEIVNRNSRSFGDIQKYIERFGLEKLPFSLAIAVTDLTFPAWQYSILEPCGGSHDVVTVTLAMAQSELKASPRNPKDITLDKSSNCEILDV